MQTTSDYDSFRTSTVPSVTTEDPSSQAPDCEMENNETCENRQTCLVTPLDDIIKHFSTGKMTDHRLEGPFTLSPLFRVCCILSPL